MGKFQGVMVMVIGLPWMLWSWSVTYPPPLLNTVHSTSCTYFTLENLAYLTKLEALKRTDVVARYI